MAGAGRRQHRGRARPLAGAAGRLANRPAHRRGADRAAVLSTHLTEPLKSNMAEILSYAEVQKLLKELPKEQAELVKDLVPSLIAVSGIQRVLQILLAERVSIRDLATIGGHRRRRRLHAQSDAAGRAYARAAGAPDLRPAHRPQQLPAADRAVGAVGTSFAEAMVGQGDERQVAMQPSKLSEFITLVREKFEEAAHEREAPMLVTSAGIRPYIRGIVECFRAQTPVFSQGEIHPRARLKTVGSI
ncbi:MAG: FHIPEP family type III secretion protein [Pseudolabrys sp.]